MCCCITSSLSKLSAGQASFALYGLAFGFVCLMALNDPKAFLVVLEVFTSAALNLESGAFVALMQTKASDEDAHPGVEVSLPLSPRLVALKPLVMAYFLAAVVFDAFQFSSEQLGRPAAVCLSISLVAWVLGVVQAWLIQGQKAEETRAAIEIKRKEDAGARGGAPARAGSGVEGRPSEDDDLDDADIRLFVHGGALGSMNIFGALSAIAHLMYAAGAAAVWASDNGGAGLSTAVGVSIPTLFTLAAASHLIGVGDYPLESARLPAAFAFASTFFTMVSVLVFSATTPYSAGLCVPLFLLSVVLTWKMGAALTRKS